MYVISTIVGLEFTFQLLFRKSPFVHFSRWPKDMMLESNTDGKGLPRKVTAVGTIGEANQLFTVYEKNWHCAGLKINYYLLMWVYCILCLLFYLACNQENYASRSKI